MLILLCQLWSIEQDAFFAIVLRHLPAVSVLPHVDANLAVPRVSPFFYAAIRVLHLARSLGLIVIEHATVCPTVRQHESPAAAAFAFELSLVNSPIALDEAASVPPPAIVIPSIDQEGPGLVHKQAYPSPVADLAV